MSTATKLDHLDVTEHAGLATHANVMDGRLFLWQENCEDGKDENQVMLSIEQMEKVVDAFTKWKHGGAFPLTVHHSY